MTGISSTNGRHVRAVSRPESHQNGEHMLRRSQAAAADRFGLGADDDHRTNFAYILSSSYSGSTLLAMLLGAQPEACTVGEIRAPQVGDPAIYRCSCGAAIKECGFWKKVNAAMAARGSAVVDIADAQFSIYTIEQPYIRRLLAPLARGPFLEAARDLALGLSPAWKTHLKSVRARNAALVQVLRELTGAKLVVDSSKEALQLKYLLAVPSLRIKVVHLVRDGRAVALSMIAHGLKAETRARTVELAARSWSRRNESAEDLLARLPASRWTRVRYEDLCAGPEQVLRRVCEFLEIDHRNLVLDFRSRQQHVLGNDMRLGSTSQIRLDDRWRTQLSREDVEVFERSAGRLNRKYGYE
jgi:hypothetical protein